LPKSPRALGFAAPQAIDHFVMAITSAAAGVRHGALTTPGISRPHKGEFGHDDDSDIEPVRGRARIPRLDHGADEPHGPRVEHDPEKPAPDLIRGGYRFSERIMLQRQGWGWMTISEK
jgi:hypothetical protein